MSASAGNLIALTLWLIAGCTTNPPLPSDWPANLTLPGGAELTELADCLKTLENNGCFAHERMQDAEFWGATFNCPGAIGGAYEHYSALLTPRGYKECDPYQLPAGLSAGFADTQSTIYAFVSPDETLCVSVQEVDNPVHTAHTTRGSLVLLVCRRL